LLNPIRQASITSQERGDLLVVSIVGPLTAGGGDMQLRSILTTGIDAGARRVVLDFGHLSTLDSSGLGELMRASTVIEACGGRMAWAGCPRTMRDILDITGVEFESVVFTSAVDEAIAALG
jgi:anti-sigma B factor antagonist